MLRNKELAIGAAAGWASLIILLAAQSLMSAASAPEALMVFTIIAGVIVVAVVAGGVSHRLLARRLKLPRSAWVELGAWALMILFVTSALLSLPLFMIGGSTKLGAIAVAAITPAIGFLIWVFVGARVVQRLERNALRDADTGFTKVSAKRLRLALPIQLLLGAIALLFWAAGYGSFMLGLLITVPISFYLIVYALRPSETGVDKRSAKLRLSAIPLLSVIGLTLLVIQDTSGPQEGDMAPLNIDLATVTEEIDFTLLVPADPPRSMRFLGARVEQEFGEVTLEWRSGSSLLEMTESVTKADIGKTKMLKIGGRSAELSVDAAESGLQTIQIRHKSGTWVLAQSDFSLDTTLELLGSLVPYDESVSASE